MTEVTTLDVPDHVTDDLRAYAAAMRAGFHESPMSEEGLAIWLAHLQADGTRLRVIRDHSRPFGKADEPVATFASWGGTLNAGRGMVDANFITDVTVQATHRRRGLMNKLMLHDLREAHERGDVVALLTATDAQIYGRFGFGVTATARRLEIDSGPKFALRTEPYGSTAFAAPEDVVDVRRHLFECFHREQFWSVGRAQHYWSTGFDWHEQRATPHRAAVHLDDDGEPDAAAVFAIESDHILVRDLLGTTRAAEIELIRLLAHAEGHEKIVWRHCFDPRHPITWALKDPRIVTTAKTFDTVWTRILDLPRAVAARSFDRDGEVTVSIDDPLGYAAGSWRLSIRDGVASAEPTSDEPELGMDIATFSTVLSGLEHVDTLASAGLVHGDPSVVGSASRLLASWEPPVAASIF